MTQHRHSHTTCRKTIPSGYYTLTRRVCEILWKYETRGQVLFFRSLTAAMSRPMINDIWQALWLDHVHINKYAKFHKILLRERIRAISILCEFRPWQSLGRPMVNAQVNGIWQSLRLDLVYINVYAIFINIITRRGNSIGSVSAWHSTGPEFDPHVRRWDSIIHITAKSKISRL